MHLKIMCFSNTLVYDQQRTANIFLTFEVIKVMNAIKSVRYTADNRRCIDKSAVKADE